MTIQRMEWSAWFLHKFKSARSSCQQVNYLDHDAATSDQDGKEPLAYINRRGNPVIRVDRHKDLAYGQNRDSVRITSKEKFKKGQRECDVIARV